MKSFFILVFFLFLQACSVDNRLNGSIGGSTSTVNKLVPATPVLTPAEYTFTASVNFTDDQNSNATSNLYYCNQTNSPGCDPLAGNTVSLNRAASQFSATTPTLLSPYLPGDTINYIIQYSDSDGVDGGPHSGTVTLDSYAATSTAITLDLNNDEYMYLTQGLTLSAAASSLSVWFQYQTGITLLSRDIATNNTLYLASSTSVDLNCSGTPSNFTVPSMVIGNWYNVVVVRAANNINVYLNGTISTTGALANSNDCIFNLFGRWSDNTGTSVTTTSELAIWDVTLSAGFTDLYNTGSPPLNLNTNFGAYADSANLLHWWKMGDGPEQNTTPLIYDLSNYGTNFPLLIINKTTYSAGP